MARRAGVSPMTVSRVLHDNPSVSDDNRRKVITAVEELGYRRNEVARSLRLGRAPDLVGLLVANLANPFYSAVALGVESTLSDHGIRVMVANTAEQVDHERKAIADLVSRRIDGIIVLPAGNEHTHLDPVRLETPIIFAASQPSGVDADAVLLDDFNGTRLATARLLAAGHRRIGFLGLPPAAWTGAERFRGFCAAFDEAGLEFDARYDRRPLRTVAAAEKATMDLLSQVDPPTALFCANNRLTIGAFRVLRARDQRVDLVGFDDFELADTLGIPLTIVAYDPMEIGRQAARLLLDRLGRGSDDRDAPPRRLVIPTTIIYYGQAVESHHPPSSEEN
nr:LacI family DNA-binding transcriptional regulator [Jiangella asiatica]